MNALFDLIALLTGLLDNASGNKTREMANETF